jgi:hypothetical protein
VTVVTEVTLQKQIKSQRHKLKTNGLPPKKPPVTIVTEKTTSYYNFVLAPFYV